MKHDERPLAPRSFEGGAPLRRPLASDRPEDDLARERPAAVHPPVGSAALGALIALAAAAATVASWPLASLLRRMGGLASVGSVATAAAALALVPIVRALPRHRDALTALDPLTFALLAALVVVDAGLVALLLRDVSRPDRSPLRRIVPVAALGVAVASAALAAVPALGLGRRQAVMIALVSRSALVKRAVGPLQQVFDREGDGHGALFGGADCDDRDPRAYPGAPEVPRNGVDESCSGRDGSARRRPAPTSPLASWRHPRPVRPAYSSSPSTRRAPIG